MLKKKWYDLILSGEKKEEYREIKQHWINRFTWHEYHSEISCVNSLKDALWVDSIDESKQNDVIKSKFYDFVEFKNGYGKNAPTVIVECKGITIGVAVPEWSDNWQGEVFVIKLGKIIK